MSARWADDHSSDEESVDQEEEELVESIQKENPTTKVENHSSHIPQEQGPEIVGFVRNISSSVSRDDIGVYFEQKGCNILNLAVRSADDARFVVARVGFADHESLDIFLKSDGDKFKGNAIHTSKNLEMRSLSSNNQGRGGRHVADVGGYGGRRGPRGSSRDDLNGSKRNDVRGRGGNSRSGREVTVDEQTAPSVPKVRTKLVLQPRTLPIENIGKIEDTKINIFGGGKAHDDFQYEEVKKKHHHEEVEKDNKAPTVASSLSDKVVNDETVFKLDALKNAVGEVRTADDAVGNTAAPIHAKGGRGHSADKAVSSGRWSNRTGSGMASEGGGRGRGRGHSSEGGRGRGGRGPPRSGLDSAASNVTRTDTSKHTGYMIEKPKDEFAADKNIARNSSKASERKGHGSEGTAKGARTKTGGSGKLFTAAAQQIDLIKPKSKTGGSNSQNDNTATSDEQKFQKAQEKIAQKDKFTGGFSGAAAKTKKTTNAFAALTGSDSEDA